jgi:hypothetical protein
MTRIDTPLLLDPLAGRQWMVYGLCPDKRLCDFRVYTETAGLIVVPQGFICDLNSIPRFLWWASTPTDFPEAGVVHDWAYRGHLPRWVADRVYAELLAFLGASKARVNERYLALRAFGWAAYKG